MNIVPILRANLMGQRQRWCHECRPPRIAVIQIWWHDPDNGMQEQFTYLCSACAAKEPELVLLLLQLETL